MKIETEEEKRLYDNGVRFRIAKASGHILGMDEQSYFELLKKENEIAKEREARESSIEEVVEDMRRYSDAHAVLSYTFAARTDPETLNASVCGVNGKIVYLCEGRMKYGPDFALGLVSAHTPGSSGGGGEGFDGNRRLYIAKGYVGKSRIDPKEWIKGASAVAYETQDGRIDYKELSRKRIAGVKDLLRIMVVKEEADLKERFSCVDEGAGI